MTPESLMQELHSELAKTLKERVTSEDATPADLNVARQFLKDNGISASPKASVPLLNLAKVMPFDPDEEEEAA